MATASAREAEYAGTCRCFPALFHVKQHHDRRYLEPTDSTCPVGSPPSSCRYPETEPTNSPFWRPVFHVKHGKKKATAYRASHSSCVIGLALLPVSPGIANGLSHTSWSAHLFAYNRRMGRVIEHCVSGGARHGRLVRWHQSA